MGCILMALCLFGGRLALFLLWIFGATAGIFQTNIWPILGFLFMPYTTMAYIGARHWCESPAVGWGFALMLLGILLDLGSNKPIITFKVKTGG